MALINYLKDALRPLKRRLFYPIDFPRSVKKLQSVQSDVSQGKANPLDVPGRFRGHGEFRDIRAAQIRAEIEGLFSLVREQKPKVVCEIGTALGGTFYLWCQAAADDALLVSMDLPGRFYSDNRRDFYSRFAKSRQRTHFLPGDSHEPQALERLKEVLQGRQIDFLFIDGDHSDAGVRKDFAMYSPLVRPGGVVAFHDILENPHNPRNKVYPLWQDLKKKYPNHKEFIERDQNKDVHANCIGIGVIWI